MGTTISSLFAGYFGKTNIRILMVGLDGAGKTTVLYKLKTGKVVTTVPTISFNVESIKYKNITFTVWDVGGQKRIRELWRCFLSDTKGLIYVIDSQDRQRLDEAREELMAFLDEYQMRDIILLVFANKQDMPGVLTASEITDKLGLQILELRKWFVQTTCAKTGDGLYEGLDWLSRELKKQQVS